MESERWEQVARNLISRVRKKDLEMQHKQVYVASAGHDQFV